MRSRISRRYKMVGALNGIDFGSILSTVTGAEDSGTSSPDTSSIWTTLINTAGSTVNNLITAQSNSGTVIPPIYNTGGGSIAPPATPQNDNTLLYAGIGLLGLATLGGIVYVASNSKKKGKKK